MKLTKKELAARKLLIDNIEKATNLLIKTCQSYCKQMDTKAIPMLVLREYERVLLDNFRKGIKR